jgi:DNA integrity scanning protein DisA with diadenylate cyclase activity
MAFEVEEDDAHPRGRSNATVTDEQGDCHRKGKRVTRRASSDVAGMSTMPENTVEVVTQNGRYILVYFYMMVNKNYYCLW